MTDPTRLHWWFGRGSGPLVARLFHRLLAIVALLAFWSLGQQVDVLVGSRGLLPAALRLEGLADNPAMGLLRMPTIFLWDASDATLQLGTQVGMGLSILALFGILPRLMWLLIVPLYLSYVTICSTFLSFQWDNLLLEAAILAVFLSRHHQSRVAHFMFRVLLFKLYFESGIAKWQSHLGDWHDGSAMAHYYETAPIPTWLAWYAHQLSEGWHQLESWFAVGIELVIPPMFFGPRWARLFALFVLTTFQLVNLATANYGFFCYIALALHVFLLDDRDVAAMGAWCAGVGRRLTWRVTDHGRDDDAPPGPWRRARTTLGAPIRWLDRSAFALAGRPNSRWGVCYDLGSVVVLAVVASLYLTASVRDGVESFTRPPAACERTDTPCWSRPPWLTTALEASAPHVELIEPLRLVNTYHLFGHITRERIEPTFETWQDASSGWVAQPMVYKPGPVDRAPPVVAPHQPRVDFRLWFYGLGFKRGMPPYVSNLLDRICHDPEAVQGLFAGPLPPNPARVRVSMDRYHFTTPEAREATGAWWSRERLGSLEPTVCDPPG